MKRKKINLFSISRLIVILIFLVFQALQSVMVNYEYVPIIITVNEGDTLYSIAEKHVGPREPLDEFVERVSRQNKIGQNIYPGQKIIVSEKRLIENWYTRGLYGELYSK